MLIVGVDPGKTTGYAVYDTKKQELVKWGETTGDFKDSIDYVLSLGDFFVVEDFRVRPSKAIALAKLPQLWPAEWIGVFRYKLDKDSWILQPASKAKALPKPKNISSIHVADAIRHIYAYLGIGIIKSMDDIVKALGGQNNDSLE